jgi:hypothetical protein
MQVTQPELPRHWNRNLRVLIKIVRRLSPTGYWARENSAITIGSNTIFMMLTPDDSDAEANLGVAFAGLGDTEKAFVHLNRALPETSW